VTERVEADSLAGCLLGGAVGDALGAPIEFDSLDEIRRTFGPRGIENFAECYGRVGAITDDTQMTLFTAEGMIRAHLRGVSRGICHVPSVIDHAYAAWMHTQGLSSPLWGDDAAIGWLVSVPDLNHRRAPGNTCLSALLADAQGTIDEPLNDSKGCGGVMRAAPVGLDPVFDRKQVFRTACEVAGLTHGHPSGYLTAGVLAETVAGIVRDGHSLDVALRGAERCLAEWPDDAADETRRALAAARSLAGSQTKPGPETVESLGEGWVAEEALAIAVYCALVADDFAAGVALAVNHSGDSDSTGAICGNLLGAVGGVEAIPRAWLEQLELRDVIERICLDWKSLVEGEDQIVGSDFIADEWAERYPPW